jgi:hypothetical protein
MTLGTLGAVTVHHAVGGTAEVLLAKHSREDRLQPLLTFTDDHGKKHAVELSAQDVVAVMGSLVRMFAATLPEIDTWWKELTGAG